MGTYYGTVPFTGTTSPNFLVTTDVLADAINRATSTAPVMTVFGRSGNVIAATGDYTFDQITNKPNSLQAYGIIDPIVLTTAAYPDPTWISSLSYSKLINTPTYATVATSGDYNDLINTPPFYIFSGISSQYTAGDGSYVTFPTALSQFTNDIGVITSNSPAFVGIPTAPTAPLGTNTTQIATTAFVIANSTTGATASVSSVFGRTGTVTAQLGDYSSFYYTLDNPSNYLTSADVYYDSTYFTGSFTLASPFALAPTGVVAGSYLNSNITVDAAGRVTSIANGIGANFSTATNNVWTGTNTFAPTFTASASTIYNLSLFSTINLSGSATYKSIFVSPFEQTLGGLPNYFLDMGTNSATGGTGTHTSKFSVDTNGNLITTGTAKFIATGSTLTFGRDTTNFTTVVIGTSGSVSFTASGSGPFFNFSHQIQSSGGFLTSSAFASSNFAVIAATTISSSTQTEHLFAGATTINARIFERGSSNSTLGIGNSYGSHIIGTQGFVAAASGTHAMVSQLVVKPVIIVGAGAASITNSASLYIENAATLTGVTGGNYAIYVNGGNSYHSGKITFDSTITTVGINGNQTINKPSGSVNIASGQTSLIFTNSLANLTSIIIPCLYTIDTTATHATIIRGSGSFTINLNAACSSDVTVGFIIFN